ncbi:hypothetical protein E1B28_012943 [Marasmius oreades]|uniref:Uncharacterized protein n=1 Tax=Marasmius oreades TaxID=181124 RepID=A0A9P7UNT1_9AGAR|nr:uncharacterized protein E1B28_012943 [Marasmius oreades]KAG7088997.1 hypothetical protein E1B28_012943 [Marasmius oreades]
MQSKLILALLTASLSSAILAEPNVAELCSRLVTNCNTGCESDTLTAGCATQACNDYCQCKYCSGGTEVACDATCKPQFF